LPLKERKCESLQRTIQLVVLMSDLLCDHVPAVVIGSGFHRSIVHFCALLLILVSGLSHHCNYVHSVFRLLGLSCCIEFVGARFGLVDPPVLDLHGGACSAPRPQFFSTASGWNAELGACAPYSPAWLMNCHDQVWMYLSAKSLETTGLTEGSTVQASSIGFKPRTSPMALRLKSLLQHAAW
jgi:hypothetical protein